MQAAVRVRALAMNARARAHMSSWHFAKAVMPAVEWFSKLMTMSGEPRAPPSLTFQSLSRTRRVSGRKCGFSPASSLACTAFRLQHTHHIQLSRLSLVTSAACVAVPRQVCHRSYGMQPSSDPKRVPEASSSVWTVAPPSNSCMPEI